MMKKWVVSLMAASLMLVFGSAMAQSAAPISRYLTGLDESHLFSLSELFFLLRLVISVGLGCLLGVMHGLGRNSISVSVKTYGSVCLGSCAFSSISTHIYLLTGLGNPFQNLGSIVTGIGFLCAAVIFKEGLSVLGLSAAAMIWATAAVGMACGVGLFGIAIVTALFIVLFHFISRKP